MMTSERLQVWQDRSIELAWSLRSRLPGRSGQAQPSGDERLAPARIVWPTEYQWRPAAKWANPILGALQRAIRTERRPIPQPYPNIVMLQFVHGRSRYDVALDYADTAAVNDACALASPLYFKMQFARDGYQWPHVVPGGYVANDSSVYRYLPHLRAMRDQRRFAYDVYGRFSLDFARDVRQAAVRRLSEQTRFRYEGGLRKIRYSRFLREVARARICIDLPGNGDFCFRLFDYFAVGACVIGPRHGTALPAPLVDRTHIAYTRDDQSDLVDLCAYYLEHADEREAMCQASRRYFDECIAPDRLAAYYLRRCLEMLPQVGA